MNFCDGPLREVLGIIQSDLGWDCTPLPDGRALISTGRRYADSEPVEIYIAPHEDMLLVSDGGESVNRLVDGGFDAADVVHYSMWRDLLREHRLNVADGVLSMTTTEAKAPDVLSRLADAMLGIDALRVLAPPTVVRPRTFANAVEDFLRERFSDEAVVRNPTVVLGDGISIRPTFSVQAKRGPIYVQTAAATSRVQAYDHAFVTFSMAARADVPMEQRLAVFGGSLHTWSVPRLKVLAERTYVALWDHRSELERFLEGHKFRSRLLLSQTSL